MKRRVFEENRYIIMHLFRSAILTVLFTGTLLAQNSANSLADLPSQVQKGDQIQVTVSDGKIFKGRYESVTDSALQMRLAGKTQNVSAMTITGIRKRRPDSNLNGALIGLAAGVGGGVIATGIVCPNDPECAAVVTLVFVPIFGAGGAGVGALIDQLTHKYDSIYTSQTTGGPHLRLSPLVSRDKKGVRLTMSF
jgi:hypothetical protein